MPRVKKQSPTKRATRKRGGVLSRLKSGWDFCDSISVLLYGRSGTGKTTFWSTFPKPILAVICSGGKQPGELKSIDTPSIRKNVTPCIVNEVNDVRELLEEAPNFATVVLDHASGFQDLTLKEILGLDGLPAQKSWGMATQQQYGQSSLMCKEVLRAFLSLECNRVIVAQERTFNDGEDSELLAPTVGAAMTPSVVGWLGPAVDYMTQTFIRSKMVSKTTKVGGKSVATKQRGKGVEYCLRVGAHDVFMTKFRTPRGKELPDSIVDPSYDKLMKIIQGV